MNISFVFIQTCSKWRNKIFGYACSNTKFEYSEINDFWLDEIHDFLNKSGNKQYEAKQLNVV